MIQCDVSWKELCVVCPGKVTIMYDSSCLFSPIQYTVYFGKYPYDIWWKNMKRGRQKVGKYEG
jgi:hypothetical protein